MTYILTSEYGSWNLFGKWFNFVEEWDCSTEIFSRNDWISMMNRTVQRKFFKRRPTDVAFLTILFEAQNYLRLKAISLKWKLEKVIRIFGFWWSFYFALEEVKFRLLRYIRFYMSCAYMLPVLEMKQVFNPAYTSSQRNISEHFDYEYLQMGASFWIDNLLHGFCSQ